MCIRDRRRSHRHPAHGNGPEGTARHVGEDQGTPLTVSGACLLYTSDAADERSSVDLGGRRIIKKKKRSMMQVDRTREETTSKEINYQKNTIEK